MTANKRTVAGAAAAFLVVVAAGMLSGCQKPDNGSADRSGRGAAAPVGATTPGASAHPAADLTPADKARTAAHKRDKADKNDKDSDKPLWRTLTQAQQVVLQPLRAEWDAMDGLRKQKWLQLANRFATLPPQEQQRVQQRMREWASLTPEQRELALPAIARRPETQAGGDLGHAQVAVGRAKPGQRQGRDAAGTGPSELPTWHRAQPGVRHAAMYRRARPGARRAVGATGHAAQRGAPARQGRAGQLGHHPERRLIHGNQRYRLARRSAAGAHAGCSRHRTAPDGAGI
jgi:hypothetical protein